MFRKLFGIAPVPALLCAWGAWGEGTFTIVGRGNGPVTIIEKNGSVRTVNLPNTAALEAQGKDHAEKLAARAKDEAEAAKLDAEAKAKLATSEAKALKEKEIAQAKELAHYNDKDYTYGPGSAKKVDRTSAVVNAKKALREGTAPVANDSSSTMPKITVGGETRIRFNQFSR